MAALMEKVRALVPTSQAKRPSSEQISGQIGEHEARVLVLRRDLEDIALDLVEGVEGASARYSKVAGQIADAERLVASLKAALPAAQRHEEALKAQARASANKAQIAAVREHLRLRDLAAKEFQEAQGKAIDAWRKLALHSEKALAVAPVDPPWPAGSLCEFGELQRAITHELWRVGSDPSRLSGAGAFPGAASPTHQLRLTPDKIPAIHETMAKASKHVMATLTGTTKL